MYLINLLLNFRSISRVLEHPKIEKSPVKTSNENSKEVLSELSNEIPAKDTPQIPRQTPIEFSTETPIEIKSEPIGMIKLFLV